MPAKPSPQVYAVGIAICQEFASELKGIKFEKANLNLTGYSGEETSMAIAMTVANSLKAGGGMANAYNAIFTLGAWLARKHAEGQLAHLASVAKGGNT